MTQKMRKRMSTVEGNIIKRIFYMPKRHRHTKLMAACKIESTNLYINKSKLKLLLRLCNNFITKKILEYQLGIIQKKRINKSCLISEISELINKEIRTIDELYQEAAIKLGEINNEIKNFRNSTETNQIRECLEKPNKKNAARLVELTKPEEMK